MSRGVYGVALLVLLAGLPPSHERDVYHERVSRVPAGRVRGRAGCAGEASVQRWAQDAADAIRGWEQRVESTQKARNLVMFLGDGMSVPTLAAARTLMGQRQGRTGEESQLAFETFPTTGMSKTYCVDAQIADSACSATAYLGGVKANIGTIGVTAGVARGDCHAATAAHHHVHSIAQWALDDGRDVGIVTTTRVTHASPAGAYAHTASRDWESDADVTASCGAAPRQDDIALQLIKSHPGNKFKVILGGGRREFLPKNLEGRRLDDRNLIEEWQEDKRAQNVTFSYVSSREELMKATSEDMPEYLLGLFHESHMTYHMQADPEVEPTLAELTEVAIKSLSRNPKGFFLFVEGGRIDHAHHDNLAQLALDETLELSAAVERATQLLPEPESLVVVTADHAHVMSLSGYTRRGGDILGPSDDLGADGVPYMTLSYANGPGFRPHVATGVRDNVLDYDYRALSFAFPAGVPLASETHGGDDVAVFARGPRHSLFAGVYEQSHIPRRMAYVACMGPGPHACPRSPDTDTVPVQYTINEHYSSIEP